MRLAKQGKNVISIHAPPRGATANVKPLLLGDKFQFTPLREGRRATSIFPKSSCYFNSRPSARGDVVAMRKEYYQGISIHAPPRGATKKSEKNVICLLFQFTPLREGRPFFFAILLHRADYFNSRPSARGDLSGALFFVPPSYFNSRPSARGDKALFASAFVAHTFQFTPLREGRPPPESLYIVGTYFNSRPSARGDSLFAQSPDSQFYFNSRPSARGDKPCCWRLSTKWTNFNSRPSARGDVPAV